MRDHRRLAAPTPLPGWWAGGWIPFPCWALSVRSATTLRPGGRGWGSGPWETRSLISADPFLYDQVSGDGIDPMRIRFCLEKALYLAKSGRPGPCWLDIPLNVQSAVIETENGLAGFDAADYEVGGTGWENQEARKAHGIPDELRREQGRSARFCPSANARRRQRSSAASARLSARSSTRETAFRRQKPMNSSFRWPASLAFL